MNKTFFVMIVLIGLLVVSVGFNFYLILTKPSSQPPPTGVQTMVFFAQGGFISPDGALAELVKVNGTALVTGKIITNSSVDFYIAYPADFLGNGTLSNQIGIAYEVLNFNNTNIRTPLGKGSWNLVLSNPGANNAEISLAEFSFNYTYFAN